MSLFDPMFLLIIVPPILAWYVQIRLSRVFAKYHTVPNGVGATGLEVARRLLSSQRLEGVGLKEGEGRMTDNYDIETNTLQLSPLTANTPSLTSLGVVAHEVGHALQDAQGYSFLRIRSGLGRRVGYLVQWSPYLLIIGILPGFTILLWAAVALMVGQVVFALVTLPIERNASERAVAMLEEADLMTPREREGVVEVLDAAALTYVAALGQRVALFVFLVLLLLGVFGFR